MLFQTIIIMGMLFILVLNQAGGSQSTSNSDSLELHTQDQKYTFHTNGLICGNQNMENYVINQKIEDFELKVPDREMASVKMNISIDVFDSKDNLTGQYNLKEIELVTNKGLPIEKRILLNLECAGKSNTSQFLIREDIAIKNDSILFSEPTISTYDNPEFKDPNMKAEPVFQGLDFPTSIAILSPDEILVTEKDKGTVQRIVNGKISDKPLIDLDVSGFAEEGLVGIAIANSTESKNPYVFLYFTASKGGDTMDSSKSLGNRLVRYELVDNQLVNPKLILELPSSYRGIHNGGKLTVGPDNNLYVTVGDIGRGHWNVLPDGQTQNNNDGDLPDGTGGILRFTLSGDPVSPSILGIEYPLNLYYAYGIRNSFGIDFDPLSGNLWDTENGDKNGDEINLVKPGFNSGWSVVEGMSNLQQEFNVDKLVNFNGKGNYSEPEFGWYVENSTTAVAPTAVKFLDSERFGEEYENDMLVANFDHGHLYRFNLTENRTSLVLEGILSDKLSDGKDDNLTSIVAKFPGGITDVQVGPDGYIYLVSLSALQGDCDREKAGCTISGGMKGAIFRVVPVD